MRVRVPQVALLRECVNALRFALLHIQSPSNFPFVGVGRGPLLFQPSTLRSSKTSQVPRDIIRNFADNPSTSQATPFWELIAAKDRPNLG